MKLDHVILGISDLQKGIDQFEELSGVRAQFAGIHPGIGTHNALVSLDDGIYLEIIAPQDNSKPLLGPFKGFEQCPNLCIVGYVVSHEPIEEIEKYLNAANIQNGGIVSGSRTTPIKEELRWETIFLTNGNDISLNPFFIHWNTDTIHPSLSNPQGCTLKSIEIADDSDSTLMRLMSNVYPQLTLIETKENLPGKLLGFSINTPKGIVKF